MNRTRWIAVPAAALAVVFGGGAGLAATGTGNPASSFVGDVADRLGISEDRLEQAIQDATIARIDAAVDAGDITKEQGEALKKRVRSGDVPSMLPSFRGSPGPKLGFPVPPIGPGLPEKGTVASPVPGGDLMRTAADYLGIDVADVHEALREGKSLAELAEDKGKSLEGLKDALRDSIREDADRAVEAGALTEEQADRVAENLGNAVEQLVEGSFKGALEFGFQDDQGDMKFDFRFAPDAKMPPAEEPASSSSASA